MKGFQRWPPIVAVLVSNFVILKCAKNQDFLDPYLANVLYEKRSDDVTWQDDVDSQVPHERVPLKETDKQMVFEPLRKALHWTMQQRLSNWGWGQDTPYTVLALALANQEWFAEGSTEVQLIKKQFELQLVVRLWRDKDVPILKGQLALHILGLVALCLDPRDFYQKDLVSMMDRETYSVDFEVAFSNLATCIAGKHIRRSKIRKLVYIIKDKERIHSIDTLSVVILTLHCVQRQRRHKLEPYIEEGLQALLQQQANDGSFQGNLHSTSMALQALMSSELSDSWNATKAQQYIMSHQEPDGSFGNIFDTNAVLPVLAAKTLLSVESTPCRDNLLSSIDPIEKGQVEDDEEAIEEPSSVLPNATEATLQGQNVGSSPETNMINVTYIIWVGNNVTLNHNITFTVPRGTTFFTIMKMAAEIDDNFEFSASKWPHGYYIHTLSGQKEQRVGYWFWLLYRLKQMPIPGVKPSNDFIVAKGVQDFVPDNSDYLLFWYHQI